MQPLHPHRGNQFAVKLASQAMNIAGGRLMHTQNGFKLFEQQLDLPPERIQGPDHVQGHPGLRHIGDQERPVAHGHMPWTAGPALSAGVGLEPPASGLGHLGGHAQADQPTGARLILALPQAHQAFLRRPRGGP